MHLSEACACRWCRPGHRARHGESRRSRSRGTPGPRSPAEKAEPEKKKRRQPEFAQMIHAASAYAMLPVPAISSRATAAVLLWSRPALGPHVAFLAAPFERRYSTCFRLGREFLRGPG